MRAMIEAEMLKDKLEQEKRQQQTVETPRSESGPVNYDADGEAKIQPRKNRAERKARQKSFDLQNESISETKIRLSELQSLRENEEKKLQ